MIDVPGYHITDTISEQTHTVTCRAFSQVHESQVVLKILNSEYPSAKKLTEFRREYEITQKLNHNGIVKVLDLLEVDNSYVLVKEDIGGDSLKNVLSQTQLDLPTFLKMSIQLAQALGHIHEAEVIHKDIKPSNIIVDLNTGLVRITDFSIATTHSRQVQQYNRADVPEGTLHYMSPEQTGRMNRGVDYRTDYYSLGATLYEALTGELPFSGDDAMELIHAHIARKPKAPVEVNAAIPEQISEIVLKLLEKKAEDRYQSMAGLKYDLEQCLKQWDEQRKIELFELGLKDEAGKFQIPEKLYGRDKEIRELFNGFEEAVDGQSVLIEVNGHAGIGKTALINEIQKEIVANYGRFLTGKFDQYNSGTPYTPLIDAFQQLARQLLTETEDDIKRWREHFNEAFGQNGQIIIDVIPEFELIIGKQPEPQELPPNEAKNRFNRLFRALVRSVATAEHPLVLFLDDVQWADQATMELIKQISSDRKLGYFYLIVAYRPEEMTASHPVQLSLEEIKGEEISSHKVQLGPLKKEHLAQLLSDTLHKSIDIVAPLAQLIHEKTNGNPFFVNEFIKTVYRQGLITYKSEEGWQWSLEDIKKQRITDNVVDLMTENIAKLSKSGQSVLMAASCIGIEFQVDFLAKVINEDTEKVLSKLEEAIQQGLIQPISDYSNELIYSETEIDLFDRSTAANQVKFIFLHDRVRQAAYSLLDEKQQIEIRYRIGHLWLQIYDQDEVEDHIFQIVNNLNRAVSLIEDDKERIQLAKLNLKAGHRALATAAYESSQTYFKQGSRLIQSTDWDAHYQMCYQLKLGEGEVEYLVGDGKQADTIMEKLIRQSKRKLDKAEVLNKQLVMHTILGYNQRAIDLGIDALGLLGERFPKSKVRVRGAIAVELAKAWKKVRGLSIDEIKKLPELTDEKGLKIMEVATNLTPPTFFSDQEKYVLNGLKMLNYSLEFGNSEYSSYAYGIYGMVLGTVFGNYQRGRDFGDLALQMNDSFDNQAFVGKLSMVYAAAINHWVTHAKDCIPILRDGYKKAVESGDLLYAGLIANGLYNIKMYIGAPLRETLQEFLKYHDFMRNSNDINNYNHYRLLLHTMRQMTGHVDIGEQEKPFSEDEYISYNREIDHDFNLVYYFVYKAQLAYVMKHYEQGWEYISKASDYILGGTGSIIETQFYFYEGLLAAANWERLTPLKRRKLTRNIKRLSKKSESGSANLSHKVELLKAEYARLKGDFKQAVRHFDEAISKAGQHGFHQHKAIANERAAELYQINGNDRVSRLYLQEAHFSYQNWQAYAKCKEMQEHYSWLKTKQDGTTTLEESSSGTSESLDINTVMKVSQSISSEIIFDNLLRTMMRIVIENAGAQKGSLVLKKNDKFFIQAQSNSNWEDSLVNLNRPISDSSQVCDAIIHYVSRTGEVLFLEDAISEGLFTGNKYIQSNQVRSVLCSPIFHHGELTGMIYLENNLTDHAFTENHLKVLNVLSSQLAISMENAQLYNEMKELNEELRQEIEDRKKSEEERIRIKAESRRKTEELEEARRYQLSMLPDAPPDIDGLDISTYLKTASEVGGDYYDFLSNGSGTLLTVTGDATGHGMSAGLMVAMTKSALNAINDDTPANILHYLNKVILKVKTNRLHMALNLIEIKADSILISSAAMPPVYLFKNETQELEEILIPGPPIGCMKNVEYDEVERTFKSGDSLVMLSDGLPESYNHLDQQMGYELIEERIQKVAHQSSDGIKDELVQLNREWAGEVDNMDDITIIVIKRK